MGSDSYLQVDSVRFELSHRASSQCLLRTGELLGGAGKHTSDECKKQTSKKTRTQCKSYNKVSEARSGSNALPKQLGNLHREGNI